LKPCFNGLLEMADYDPNLVGRVFDDDRTIHITADMIAKYCIAVGETSSLYTDSEAAKNGPYGGPVAPLSIVAAFGAGDSVLRMISFGWPRLAAGMDLEFVAPIRPGDSLTISSRIEQFYEKTGRSGPRTFVVIRSTYRNQHGEVVAFMDQRFTSRRQ
jgi:acyl dehydratase